MRARDLALAVLVGVLFRLLLLALSGNPEPQHDEKTYLFLAVEWNRFGVCLDWERFLWPPGYPWLLAAALNGFGTGALVAVKVAQCVADGLVGLSVALLAARWFSARAGTAAAWGWALFVPLAAYTHFLFTESLFLALFAPALLLLVRAADAEPARALRDAAIAGALLGLALLMRELALWLGIVGSAWLAFAARRHGVGAALQRALLVPLAAAVVVLPWTLRNVDVYGRAVPSGMTLAENCFKGLNRDYRNLELLALEGRKETEGASFGRPSLVAPPSAPAWERPVELERMADRQRETIERGLDYARADPSWFLRVGVQKLADLVAPRSFLLRALALRDYPGPIAQPAIARPLVALSTIEHVAALLLAAVGLAAARDARARALALLVIGLVLATGFLVALSRYFLPAMPLVLALAAGGATQARAAFSSRGRAALAIGGIVLLGALWWIGAPGTIALLGQAWSPP
jgi:hypothetical protein